MNRVFFVRLVLLHALLASSLPDRRFTVSAILQFWVIPLGVDQSHITTNTTRETQMKH